MKDYPYVPGWRQNKDNNKPAINHSVLMLSKYGVSEGEWDGNEWIQYRWSGKFKDSDVLYWIHLEDLQQLEKEGDGLQQEQPEMDLEKEIDRLWESFADEMEGPHNLFDIYARLARHFAKWGAEHASGSSEIPNDLEEAAKEYAKTTFKKPHSDNPDEEVTIVEPDKYAGFIAGAKWDREQMMSKAISGWLDEDNEPPYDLNVVCEEKIPFGKFKHNDKVRIIIVKED